MIGCFIFVLPFVIRFTVASHVRRFGSILSHTATPRTHTPPPLYRVLSLAADVRSQTNNSRGCCCCCCWSSRSCGGRLRLRLRVIGCGEKEKEKESRCCRCNRGRGSCRGSGGNG